MHLASRTCRRIRKWWGGGGGQRDQSQLQTSKLLVPTPAGLAGSTWRAGCFGISTSPSATLPCVAEGSHITITNLPRSLFLFSLLLVLARMPTKLGPLRLCHWRGSLFHVCGRCVCACRSHVPQGCSNHDAPSHDSSRLCNRPPSFRVAATTTADSTRPAS